MIYQKGRGRVIEFNGKVYKKDKKRGHILYFTCVDKECSGSLQCHDFDITAPQDLPAEMPDNLVIKGSRHGCGPDPDPLNKLKFDTELKNMSSDDGIVYIPKYIMTIKTFV